MGDTSTLYLVIREAKGGAEAEPIFASSDADLLRAVGSLIAARLSPQPSADVDSTEAE